jgi:hypothetical protein
MLLMKEPLLQDWNLFPVRERNVQVKCTTSNKADFIFNSMEINNLQETWWGKILGLDI